MDWRNRVGLYGSYFFGMAAIGFTLPYLPLYLGEKGLSDRAIGIVSTLAALDGIGNGLFAVVAAAWVADRQNDPKRSGEAMVIVGSCLVLGSAIGPAGASFLVGPLGYRGLFGALAALGAVATAIVVFFVPETLDRDAEPISIASELPAVA